MATVKPMTIPVTVELHITPKDAATILEMLRLQDEQIKTLRYALIYAQRGLALALRQTGMSEGMAHDKAFGPDSIHGLGYARWPGEGVQESQNDTARQGNSTL